MSGFIAVVNTDGAPVDPDLLWALTRSMAYRGPDCQEVRIQGQVGFGHTMLRTTPEAERERQPCALDGDVWIAADCRIDAREDLIRELIAHGRSDVRHATDPELILHAWAVWEAGCVSRLTGDFSFALWDGRTRRLFCARDQMGVKPFFYAVAATCLIAGNTLNSLRLHPLVSPRLNDLAVADHLLFGHGQDPDTTIFADIRRLPPAHTLDWSGGAVRTERYWTIPIDPPLRLGRHGDYVEQFLHLFRAAIRDRLRTDHAGILMSGGLDSTAIAAIARELSRNERPVKLSAHSLVFDRLIPDRERHFAGLAAAHLGLPIHFHSGDDYGFFAACLRGDDRSPEPGFITDFGSPGPNAEMAGIARESRVALYGEGADNALHYEWKHYLRHELTEGHYGQVVKDVALFPLLFRQFPLTKRLRSRRKAAPTREVDPVPPWVNADFAAELRLAERFAHFSAGPSTGTVHPIRRGAYQSLFIPLWSWMFEWHDPGVTGLPLEVRHPFLDLKLMRFLLAVPVIPWCRDKYLIRHALRGYLPREIVTRPKASLAGFPAFERYREIGLPENVPVGALGHYVDVEKLRTATLDGQELLGMRLRTMGLAFFLRRVSGECTIDSR